MGKEAKHEDEALESGLAAEEREKDRVREVPVAVVEQRVSNLVQGSLCELTAVWISILAVTDHPASISTGLVLMTGPFQHVLGLIPKGVLAGLFWYMGSDAIFTSGVTALFLFLIRDRHLTDPQDPLHRVRKSRIWAWLMLELIGFAATFAITQTIAAIGFPVVIALLVPFRVWVIPRMRLFTPEELDILDGPVASPFTMESVGGEKAEADK